MFPDQIDGYLPNATPPNKSGLLNKWSTSVLYLVLTTVDGRNPKQPPRMYKTYVKKKWDIYIYLPYQLVSRISEPSTGRTLFPYFKGRGEVALGLPSSWPSWPSSRSPTAKRALSLRLMLTHPVLGPVPVTNLYLRYLGRWELVGWKKQQKKLPLLGGIIPVCKCS